VSCFAGCDVVDRCEGRAGGLKFNNAENLPGVDSANRQTASFRRDPKANRTPRTLAKF
jgi:hypothetical protein